MRRRETFVLGALLLGCAPKPAPASAEPPAPQSAAVPAPVASPKTVIDDVLPELRGSLPEVPSNVLKVTVSPGAVGVGQTQVAALDSGELSDASALSLQRAMTVAGSANRPVGIFAAPTASGRAVVDAIAAAHDSGSNVVGLVARMNGQDVGWMPVNIAAYSDERVLDFPLRPDHQDISSVVEQTWSLAQNTHRINIRVPAEMKAQALYEALMEFRGPGCAEQPGACRFAALGLTSAPEEGTIGLGNVGLIGKGGGGGSGSGYGVGGGGVDHSNKTVPRIRQAKAAVKGALDKDIIRRIVRAHINEVRHCYNKGLANNPILAGRIAVKFTILASGKVGNASIDSTTLDDKTVGQCITKAVKRWKFPKPQGGGKVHVTYPFVLEPG